MLEPLLDKGAHVGADHAGPAHNSLLPRPRAAAFREGSQDLTRRVCWGLLQADDLLLRLGHLLLGLPEGRRSWSESEPRALFWRGGGGSGRPARSLLTRSGRALLATQAEGARLRKFAPRS
jgi:hypothetical protein